VTLDYLRIITDQSAEISEHVPTCSRCKLKSDASALRIEIFEWPLSPEPSTAKTTVFELNPPEAFTNWRDASLHFKTDILQSVYESPRSPHHQYTLASHKDLSNLLSKAHYQDQRIIPMSEIKAHSDTYYLRKREVANLQEDEVCPDNALKYRYYDRFGGKWCTVLNSSEELPSKLLYILPKRSATLERFLYRPDSAPDGLPSNEPIVSNPSVRGTEREVIYQMFLFSIGFYRCCY
jgi:hypothetical protein